MHSSAVQPRSVHASDAPAVPCCLVVYCKATVLIGGGWLRRVIEALEPENQSTIGSGASGRQFPPVLSPSVQFVHRPVFSDLLGRLAEAVVLPMDAFDHETMTFLVSRPVCA